MSGAPLETHGWLGRSQRLRQWMLQIEAAFAVSSGVVVLFTTSTGVEKAIWLRVDELPQLAGER